MSDASPGAALELGGSMLHIRYCQIPSEERLMLSILNMTTVFGPNKIVLTSSYPFFQAPLHLQCSNWFQVASSIQQKGSKK